MCVNLEDQCSRSCLPTGPKVLQTHKKHTKIVAVGGLLGGALGRMFGGSPPFLFVFYRPYRRANLRSESRMVSSTYKRTL